MVLLGAKCESTDRHNNTKEYVYQGRLPMWEPPLLSLDKIFKNSTKEKKFF